VPGAMSFLVGRALGSLRARSKRPLSSVGRAAKVSRDELLAIESGRLEASIDVLDRIARALGSTLLEVIRSSKQWFGTPAPRDAGPLALADIGRAIADLPASDGSKVDRATSAAVVHAFDASGGNQSAAARLLGMERKAFVRRCNGRDGLVSGLSWRNIRFAVQVAVATAPERASPLTVSSTAPPGVNSDAHKCEATHCLRQAHPPTPRP
jgi:transcriptional regulator with XRE-family HTH domain